MCSKKFWLLGILLIGAVLRFYKLDWGQGFFFHPDEYHIAAAVGRLSFPSQMHPHLFTYGSFTVYLIYFTKLSLAAFNLKFFNLDPILLGRFYSALFSTLTIAVVFLIAKKLVKNNWGPCLAAALAALTPGLIQQAHFATPESILTFWLSTTLLLVLNWHEKKKLRFLYLAAAALGLALATKVVAAIFLPLLIIPSQNLLRLLKRPRKLLVYSIKLIIFPLIITGLVFFLVFPYAVLDYSAFRGSMNYETGVGEGQPLVFYTRQFIETTPIFFQIQKIFPYALGPGLEILGILGFFCFLFSIRHKPSAILLLSFLLYFLPSAFLFAKWTRFMAPVFPFFAIFTAYFLSRLKNKILLVTCAVLLVTNFLWTMMFFSIYRQDDIRVAATGWTKTSLPATATVFTEQGNMIEVPMGGNFKKLSLDFYGLEENPETRRLVPEYLAQADYFIVQSRRLFANHQRLPQLYPLTARFYNLLFSGALGFEEIKGFNSFPQFSIFNFQFSIPDEVGEETWSVFDHPVIRIYQKTTHFAQDYYRGLLKY